MVERVTNFILGIYKVAGILILIFITYVVVVNALPTSIIYYQEINKANAIIEQIETLEGKLPENTDWVVLWDLGLEDVYEIDEPRYHKISENEFELVYYIGFDGPHLVWNSDEKIWKKGFPER